MPERTASTTHRSAKLEATPAGTFGGRAVRGSFPSAPSTTSGAKLIDRHLSSGHDSEWRYLRRKPGDVTSTSPAEKANHFRSSSNAKAPRSTNVTSVCSVG